MKSKKLIKNYIGYSIIFIYSLMEWERTLIPEINFIDFYNDDNFTKNLWISIFNSLVEITEPCISFDPRNFAFINDFLQNKDKITKEYEKYSNFHWPVSYKLFDSSILENNEKGGNYNYQFVKFYELLEKNAVWYPVLSRLFKKYPEVATGFFSEIKGELKIKTHRGPYRGLIRGHITIKNEETNNCKLIVHDGMELKWKTGNAFVFDDTYFHRLDKWGDGTRTSFIFDIKRQFKSENMNKLNTLIIDSLNNSDYVMEIRQKL